MDAARHSISSNQALYKGEAIFSLSGNHKAEFQNDGNFVLYQMKQVWASNTAQFNADCIVLEDNGTLGFYRGGKNVFTIGDAQPQSIKRRLNVSDDGHLTITECGKVIWTQ